LIVNRREEAKRNPFHHWLDNEASIDYRVLLDDFYLGLMEETFWAGAEYERTRREMSGEEG